ncbi:ABC transporter permease [Tomitella fengzijianii]|uniref:ABC transporter permease n=1 Tax=Tomitella fengzijianii TaxID=2597660 RepID=A0A516X262_9ACTN|nr:ABC transporter permease [Tomitella fengzijianii]QDQ97107.1 ABC transporter permease [Tomitella fengzijianii]
MSTAPAARMPRAPGGMRAARPAGGAAAAAVTGTAALVRLHLRRDRLRLGVWIAGLIAVTGASANAVQGVYGDAAERATYAATMDSSPATIAMGGPPVALETAGGITVFETNSISLVGVALMVVFLTVRYTRGEEETGRTELLRAGVLGPRAPLTAAGLLAAAASVLVGAGIAAVFLALGLPAAGSVLFGAEVAVTGIAFTAVSLVCAQVLSHARAATGLGAALVGAAFAVRAVGDVGGGTLSWFSPIGWAQAAHPFGGDRWWPLALPLILAVAAAGTAWRLDGIRDVGGSLVAPRLGPAAAPHSLASAPAWAFRIQRAAIAGWAAGMVLAGAALGSVGSQVADMVRGNEQMEKVFGGAGGIVDQYFAMVALLLGLLTAGFAASTVLRLRGEETSGRAELLVVAGVSRRRWIGGWLAVTAAAAVVLAVCGAAGAAVADALATGDASQLARIFGAMLVPLAAVAVVGGLAAALVGLAPRVQHVTWVVVAWAYIAGWFGDLLGLPGWAVDLSPFSWAAQAPAETMGWSAWLVTLAVGAALAWGGVEGLRRRDLQAQ